MDLSDNQIGDLGAEHLIESLEQNRVIVSSRLFSHSSCTIQYSLL